MLLFWKSATHTTKTTLMTYGELVKYLQDCESAGDNIMDQNILIADDKSKIMEFDCMGNIKCPFTGGYSLVIIAKKREY
jgi:hypothetical protein